MCSTPEIDEFWNDCIKCEQKKDKKVSKSNHGILKVNSSTNFNEVNDGIFIDKLKKKKNNLLKKHKLLETILRTEMSIPANKEKIRQKQIKILTSLYDKDLLDKTRVNKELEKLRKQKEIDELKDCSFKPKTKYKKINKSYDEKYIKKFGEKNIYERNKIYQKNFQKKLDALKKEEIQIKEEENETNTFKPEIKPKNLEKVLSQNNVWERKANNISNKFFLMRYMKARKEESDKKKRLVWSMDKKEEEQDININNDNDYSNNKIVQRSISQKDSLIYKRELHFSLMSFQTNNDSEDNNVPKI
jgi:hypothetical protein